MRRGLFQYLHTVGEIGKQAMSKDERAEDAFDIEDWLSDAHLPEATVRVNKFGHLAARLADLDAAHTAAKREDAADVRLSSKNGAAYPIAQEIEKVRAQMESGWLTIRLRGLTSAEIARATKVKGEDQVVRQIAMQIVEPKMTEAQVKVLRDRIGVGQFTAVVNTASEVAFGEVRTPDFSAAVSATLATAESSKN